MARLKTRIWRFLPTPFREILTETPLPEKLYAVRIAKTERLLF